ncbi:MAG: sodium-dependent bicarbonate transport family permease [Arenimonas sp.]|uniref:sodium-dependent bicarbonate transport family permease n=1 Tax=Arenimonas sp. TaxID=1872635 RepID=UPI0025B7EB66|nr:sodium-dependent bicarbonate transport family permease [Arenimonas sp.]MBW8368616.1 sodium-dependent bicarbonate transport family permease [Arenimonas sp.]
MPIATDLLTANLLSPVVLAFVLGMVARSLRSDLEVPPAIQVYLSIFLLLAIGMKGAVALRQDAPDNLALMLAVTVLTGIATAAVAYWLARTWLRDDALQAGALAAHYGSVSAVTFIAAQQFTERSGMTSEPVLVALLVALEIPAILIGIGLARGGGKPSWHQVREVLTGRTAILLLGGMAIGAIAGKQGVQAVDAMYVQLFQGMLMLFMLDMGMVAAGQLRQLQRGALRLVVFGTALPLLNGLVGAWIGLAMGLGTAGATVFATMVASASYIAAPASVRASLPGADAGRCVTAALGITFPFNLAIGIPTYAAFAAWLAARAGA